MNEYEKAVDAAQGMAVDRLFAEPTECKAWAPIFIEELTAQGYALVRIGA